MSQNKITITKGKPGTVTMLVTFTVLTAMIVFSWHTYGFYFAVPWLVSLLTTAVYCYNLISQHAVLTVIEEMNVMNNYYIYCFREAAKTLLRDNNLTFESRGELDRAFKDVPNPTSVLNSQFKRYGLKVPKFKSVEDEERVDKLISIAKSPPKEEEKDAL